MIEVYLFLAAFTAQILGMSVLFPSRFARLIRMGWKNIPAERSLLAPSVCCPTIAFPFSLTGWLYAALLEAARLVACLERGTHGKTKRRACREHKHNDYGML